MRFLFIDQSTRLKTANDLKIIPRGGMVQSLFRVTDYLSLQKHYVVVLSDIDKPGLTNSGTRWVNELIDIEYDVLICNRGIGNGYPHIKAKRRILWVHDLPHSGFIPDPKMASAFEVVFMSRYAEKIWREFYKFLGKSYFIPNGIDKFFYPRDKNLHQIIYFSHPNRGLKRLDFIADCLQQSVSKEIQVDVYSSPSMYPTDGEMGDYVDMDLISTQGHLNIHDPLPTRQIAKKVGAAGLCIMPTGYPEICSNSVLQALASGTPIITTGNLGATPEWVKHNKNGMLTKYLPNDYMIFTVEIVRHATNVLLNEKKHRKLIEGAKNTKILTWKQVGEKWLKLLTKKRFLNF